MLLSRLLPLLAALLALTTAALVGRLSVTAWQSDERAAVSLQSVKQLRLALVAAEMVSRERGPTNGMLGESLPPRPERVQALREARARTDSAWLALGESLPAVGPEALRRDAMERLGVAQAALTRARAAVDRTVTVPKDERSPQSIRAVVHEMVALVPILAPVVSMLANEAQQAYPALSDDVQSARLVSELREYAGLLGSHFTAALARRKPFTQEERLAVERTRGRIDGLRFLLDVRIAGPGQAAVVTEAWDKVKDHYFGVAGQLVDRVIATGEADGAYDLDPAAFAALYVPEMNVMFGLRDALLDRASARAQGELERSGRLLVLVSAVSLLVVLVLTATIIVVHHRVLRPLAATTHALKALARNDLQAALPRPVANDEIAAVIGAVHTLREQTQERERLEQERDGLIEQLRTQSNSDFLTGLPNRRAFYAAAERELAQARRHGHVVAAILFDIDNFKAFNDRLGHAAGDCALMHVAQVLRSEMRAGDLVGRYGGEEFVLLLSHCSGDLGVQFAERLRTAIAAKPVVCTNGVVAHVTASLGVADSRRHDSSLASLLSRADAAMYRAKAGGRNRVELADGPPQDALNERA